MTTPHQPQPHTDGWQTMETAPKDGTDILCVCMKTKEGCEKYLGHMEVDCWKDRYHGFGKFNNEAWPATHWRPLPDLPKPPSTTQSQIGDTDNV